MSSQLDIWFDNPGKRSREGSGLERESDDKRCKLEMDTEAAPHVETEEIAKLKLMIERLEKTNERLEKTNESQKNDLNEEREFRQDLYEQLDKKENALKELEEAAEASKNELQESLALAEDERDKARKDVSKHKKTINTLNERLLKVLDEKQNLEKQVEGDAKKMRTLRDSYENAVASKKEAEARALKAEEECKTLQLQVAERTKTLERQLEDAIERATGAEEECKALGHQVEAANRGTAEAEQTIRTLQLQAENAYKWAAEALELQASELQQKAKAVSRVIVPGSPSSVATGTLNKDSEDQISDDKMDHEPSSTNSTSAAEGGGLDPEDAAVDNEPDRKDSVLIFEENSGGKAEGLEEEKESEEDVLEGEDELPTEVSNGTKLYFNTEPGLRDEKLFFEKLDEFTKFMELEGRYPKRATTPLDKVCYQNWYYRKLRGHYPSQFEDYRIGYGRYPQSVIRDEKILASWVERQRYRYKLTMQRPNARQKSDSTSCAFTQKEYEALVNIRFDFD